MKHGSRRIGKQTELLCLLGNDFIAQGNQKRAIICFKKAAKFSPFYAKPYNSLGYIYFAQGQQAVAEACFRQAIKLKPDYAEPHNNLGKVLCNRGLLTESEFFLRRALEISPTFNSAFLNLAATLTLLGRFDEAEACFKRVIEINPDDVDALVGMGHAASHWGRFAEAEDFFRRALMINPKLPSALSAVVSLRKMTLEDNAWLISAEEIVQQKISHDKESIIRFAMGKYCDDLQDFDRAFLNYQRANELLKTSAKGYDQRNQTLLVDTLIRTYNCEKISLSHESASNSTRPVFVVGMPRSGTSLTEQIIASHRAAFGAGELLFWDDAHIKCKNGGVLSELTLRQLGNDYLRLLARFSVDAIRVVDKMPGNFSHLGLIHSVFPNARIIHMQRDPIDTCVSIYFQSFSHILDFANDLPDLAHYYLEYHRLMTHWRSILPPGVLLEVPYESLILDQEKWSRKILEFIGLDWDEQCLAFYKTERRVATASDWQVRQKIYPSSIERWRHYEKFLTPLMGLMNLRGVACS